MIFLFPFLRNKHFLVIAICFICITANGQDLEPRAYANVPKGVNTLAVVYGFLRGNVVTDPSLPIAGFTISSHNLGIGYVRTFELANKLARVQVNLPYTSLSGKLKINGRDTSGGRSGLGDTRIRFGINLLGSPALDKKDFRNYQQKTILGVSLVTSVPTGLYYKDKAINIGTHRWAFKPEVGISKRFKNVYAEAYAGVWLYTNNNVYLVSKVEEQKPLFSLQTHVSYYFKNNIWIGFNGNWFNGGETIIDDARSGIPLDNYRIGATFSVPFAKYHSLKLQFNTGAFTNRGLDYNMVSLGYAYIFF